MRKDRISSDNFSEYQLGIFWGIASFSDDRTTFRCKNKYFLDIINKTLNNTVYLQYAKDKDQYVLKSQLIDIESFIINNWTDRNAYIRDVPSLKCYKDFLRAYIELHSSLDYSTRYSNNRKNKYKALRLRIYGNFQLIDSINHIINKEIPSISLKTTQKAANKTTRVLYYSSPSEIIDLFSYIEGEEKYEEYWEEVKIKMKTPRKEY